MSRNQRGTLAAAGLGFVVVLLDVSVVNVALDALRGRFATDVTGLQWVVNAYTLAFASLLLTTGVMGDRFGARRVFTVGLTVFTVASIMCGMANSLPLLVTSRVVQGVGAALLVPNSLAMLRQTFPDTEQRSRAVGWWGAAGGIALAAGPVLSGLLVTHVGWRSIFLINLPIGVVGVALALRHAASTPSARSRNIDFPGQLVAIVALVGLTVCLTEAARLGWQHPVVYGALLLSVVATLIFVSLESRSAEPMLPLALFQTAAFSTAATAGVVVNFAYYGLIFVFSLFFQIEQKFSPQQTGLAFLPMTVVLMAVNILAGRLLNRVGARKLMTGGMVIAASGYLLLFPVRIAGSYWLLVVPMLIAASGIALMVPTMTNIALSSVDASRSGIASGVLNSARQVGGMLGVAVFGFFVRDTSPDAFMQGMHLSIACATALLLLGSVMCAYGIREPHVAHTELTSEKLASER
ncbi:MFS transporter [Burkholderia multivorans]|nr:MULTISPECIES: MFS transporter [Burkholderia]MCA8456874.1 MFS transporter [Burkholderia multivorans]MCA8482003.1 MFS transporter [Burkholderia multivorans]MCA8483308.1 MFS transporter [Burkholderia multivorans]MDN7872476.1 MFS transporter [Burkholderia multivorans]